MGESSKRSLKRQKSTTDVWFGREPEDLPLRKLAPLEQDIFAAYSGPTDGLCYVEKLKHQKKGRQGRFEKKICGSDAWSKKNRKAYGIATSLYDQHPVKKCISGDPIADSFALCARTNNSLLVIADGVNWGEKSMLAARCAVYGAVSFINTQLFSHEAPGVKDTQEVFALLLKALQAAHECILEYEGGLTTLCVALVLPTRARSQYTVCIANVGDSLAYVYSRAHGVREITTGSHDISSERDIRDAGGALGPVSGTNPELNNLTCSMTLVDVGDIVFLTTDGISDNFDPVVTKIAVAKEIKAKATEMEKIEECGKNEETKDNVKDVIETKDTDCIKEGISNTSTPCNSSSEVKILETGNVDKAVNNALKNCDTDVTNVCRTDDNIQHENANQISNLSISSQIVDSSRSEISETQINSGQIIQQESSIIAQSVCEVTCARSPQEINANVVPGKSEGSEESRCDPGTGVKLDNKETNNEALQNEQESKKHITFMTEKAPETPHTPLNTEKRTAYVNRPKSQTMPVKSISKKPTTLELQSSKKPKSALKNKSGSSIALSPCAEDYNSESFSPEIGVKDGKPEMVPHERHKYASKEMEKVVLEYELMTEDSVCAQELCGALLQHVLKLTNTKRNVLEDPKYYGKKLRKEQRKARDAEIFARMGAAPGKLDHASIVAYEVGVYRGDADENYERSDAESDISFGSHDDSSSQIHDDIGNNQSQTEVKVTPISQEPAHSAPPSSENQSEPSADKTPVSPLSTPSVSAALDIPFIDDSEDSEEED